MGYQRNNNVQSYKNKTGYEANRVSSEKNAVNNPGNRETETKQFELAEVIDVIRSSDHPNYKTNEDIGKARVRNLISDFDRKAESLPYAYSMKSRFKDYPIQNELVLTTTLQGRRYYIQTANHRTNPEQNTAPLISVNKTPRGGAAGDYDAAASGIDQSSTDEVNPEGDGFEVSTEIMPLRHRTGDTVIEGRFGNSMRFGRDADQNPLIQLRVGQRDKVTSADYITPFFEDVNKDPTSIYLTDEPVEFPLDPDGTPPELKPTTVDFEDHLFSAENTPDAYNNAQILMATNRIVMNAKERQIMGFAKKDINWTTLANFTVDAKKRIKTLSKNGNVHISEGYHDILPEGNVHIATESEAEPVARGQQTHDRLVTMLQTLQVETHPTPCGPSGPPTQASTYSQVEQKVKDTVRSEKIFVDEVGEKVSREMSPVNA
jgi:hypothetical protein